MPLAQDKVLHELNTACHSGDANAVESAVTHAYEMGLKREYVPALLALLTQRTHTRHEDIVSSLQMLRDPRAVDALYDTALVNHEYLAYDKLFGLARKCTWALADIGTPEARARLVILARNSNSQIAAYAQKRLDSWDDERQRKQT